MIGVVADDLTGAAELGAVGLRHGLRAEIVRLAADGANTGAEVVCVDSDSRSCAPDVAGERAAVAAESLVKAGAGFLYKKVDSVLRGQVMAELAAIMRSLKIERALLAPANPSLGRLIRNGRYFVHGTPLDETEFRLDPEYPRTSSRVLDLLRAPGDVALNVCRPGDALPDSGIVVCEIGGAEDLKFWAGCIKPGWLAAGGAEFFAALLAARGQVITPAVKNRSAPAGGYRELFISGTTSESSREFVADCQRSEIPVFSLPEEIACGHPFTTAAAETIASRAVEAFREHRRVILRVGLPPVTDPSLARSLAGHLVTVAERVLGQAKVERLYVEGGATAVELARRMRWGRLAVVGELALGVATLAVDGGTMLELTMKPGSYVWPEALRHSPRPNRSKTFEAF